MDNYFDRLVSRERVIKRRKQKFRPNGVKFKRKIWKNHTGNYHDEERLKGPKYWRANKRIRVYNPINSHKDLTSAIDEIRIGNKNYSSYRGATGMNGLRFRVAQSWRDNGIEYKASSIAKLTLTELKAELGFGKPAYFGRSHKHSRKSRPI